MNEHIEIGDKVFDGSYNGIVHIVQVVDIKNGFITLQRHNTSEFSMGSQARELVLYEKTSLNTGMSTRGSLEGKEA